MENSFHFRTCVYDTSLLCGLCTLWCQHEPVCRCNKSQWSEDSDIVKVKKGKLKAKDTGTTKIKVKVHGKTFTFPLEETAATDVFVDFHVTFCVAFFIFSLTDFPLANNTEVLLILIGFVVLLLEVKRKNVQSKLNLQSLVQQRLL